MTIRISLFISVLFMISCYTLSAQKKFSLHISGHYGYHFTTINNDQSEGRKGRFGNGVELRYYLGDQAKTINTAIGIGYSRFGFSREFQWTDETPERVELYGKFPINYEMWDDFHYISFPFYLNLNTNQKLKVGLSMALDYPIGTGYFRERKSADELVVDSYSEKFSNTKLYPWNTSIGASILIGKTIEINESIGLVIESQFKVYSLLAFRSNDYYPLEEEVRPYTAGLSIGLRF